MESKKSKNYFLKMLLISFLLFVIFYISKEAGYYEYKMFTRSRLTNESIKKFENDINEGKDVSLNKYVVEDYVDYSTNLTKFGSNVGIFIEDVMNNGIKKTLKIVSALFYE